MVEIAELVTAAVIAVLVGSIRDDPGPAEGYVKIIAINSHIVIGTKRIDRVVAVGVPTLHTLIDEMKGKDTSLDTFTRCYSACDQILSKAGLKEGIRWHGGHVEMEKATERVIGTSRIDGDSPRFRQEQIDEIIRQAKKIGINLGKSG